MEDWACCYCIVITRAQACEREDDRNAHCGAAFLSLSFFFFFLVHFRFFPYPRATIADDVVRRTDVTSRLRKRTCYSFRIIQARQRGRGTERAQLPRDASHARTREREAALPVCWRDGVHEAVQEKALRDRVGCRGGAAPSSIHKVWIRRLGVLCAQQLRARGGGRG